MAQRIFNLLLAAILFAVIAFLAAPWFAFRALKADARDQDVQGLAEIVDYAAVRAGLATLLGPAAGKTPPAPGILTDPIGAVRRVIRPPVAPPPKVDAYVTPDGLYALTRGYAPGQTPPPASDAPRDRLLRAVGDWPRLRFWGVRRVRFAVACPDRPDCEALFTFQRRGLYAWKLVQIRPPGPRRG